MTLNIFFSYIITNMFFIIKMFKDQKTLKTLKNKNREKT